jgi:hypothetical protein
MKHIVNVARIRPSSAKTDALSALNKQTASKRLMRPSSGIQDVNKKSDTINSTS